MAIWGVRAGRHGENESYALDHNVIVIGWDELGDFSAFHDREQINQRMTTTYPQVAPTAFPVWTGEVWAFKSRIKDNDVVVVPLKTRSAFAVGRTVGPYRFDPLAPEGARHQRPVKWIRTDLPRSAVDQDILFSFGSTLTVFQPRRSDAESRFVAIAEGRVTTLSIAGSDTDVGVTAEESINLEEVARDKVSERIGRVFRGHDLAYLMGRILEVQGYRVEVAPPGADGGVDIIAGKGPMGFDPPRMVVQVKSSDTPIDVSVLRELQGVMPNFGATHGLIISWGGFKESVRREARRLFFSIRLWNAEDVVSALQDTYERLPVDLQEKIPLRRIWIVAPDE